VVEDINIDSGAEAGMTAEEEVVTSATELLIEDLEARMAELEVQIASMSAELETQSIVDDVVISEDISLSDTPIFTELTVLGGAVLGDTVVNGILNVGTVQIDSTNNSIDAIGTLSIQALALGDIEFMGGRIVFDTEGNIDAGEVTVEKINISSDSAGSDFIYAGETSVFIATDRVSEYSLIFVTASSPTPYPITVTEKSPGEGFSVEVVDELPEDVGFDWWIVDKLSGEVLY